MCVCSTLFPLQDGPLHAKMQEVEVPVVGNKNCEKMFLANGGFVTIPRIMMCAGYAEGKRDACEVSMIGSLPITFHPLVIYISCIHTIAF